MPPRGLHGNAKPKDFKKSFLRILTYYKKHIVKVIFAFIGLFGNTLFVLIANSRFLQGVLSSLEYVTDPTKVPTDAIGLTGIDLINFKWASQEGYSSFLFNIIMMFVFFMLGALCSFMFNRLMGITSRLILEDFRNSLFSSMEKLPIRYFDTHTHGELMSRYTSDIDAMRQMISMSIPQTVSGVITIVSTFIVMCTKSL